MHGRTRGSAAEKRIADIFVNFMISFSPNIIANNVFLAVNHPQQTIR
jgi:hypothetical protein